MSTVDCEDDSDELEQIDGGLEGVVGSEVTAARISSDGDNTDRDNVELSVEGEGATAGRSMGIVDTAEDGPPENDENGVFTAGCSSDGDASDGDDESLNGGGTDTEE